MVACKDHMVFENHCLTRHGVHDILGFPATTLLLPVTSCAVVALEELCQFIATHIVSVSGEACSIVIASAPVGTCSGTWFSACGRVVADFQVLPRPQELQN
eukprot:4463126-Amphidinium_carterae.1